MLCRYYEYKTCSINCTKVSIASYTPSWINYVIEYTYVQMLVITSGFVCWWLVFATAEVTAETTAATTTAAASRQYGATNDDSLCKKRKKYVLINFKRFSKHFIFKKKN